MKHSARTSLAQISYKIYTSTVEKIERIRRTETRERTSYSNFIKNGRMSLQN